jgi:hypothetical protein
VGPVQHERPSIFWFSQFQLKEQKRVEDLEHEAKKLKEFLEDYDDDRDDSKYYKVIILSIFYSFFKSISVSTKHFTKNISYPTIMYIKIIRA